MSRLSSWPADSMPALLDFHGPLDLGADGGPAATRERDHLAWIQLPCPVVLSRDPARTVRRIACHRLVAESLKRVRRASLSRAGSLAGIQAARHGHLGGGYEFRRIAGSSRLSVHAFEAAIDHDPGHSPFGTPCHPGRGRLPVRVVRSSRAEGWRWDGDVAPRPDCMHFQATT